MFRKSLRLGARDNLGITMAGGPSAPWTTGAAGAASCCGRAGTTALAGTGGGEFCGEDEACVCVASCSLVAHQANPAGPAHNALPRGHTAATIIHLLAETLRTPTLVLKTEKDNLNLKK
jgi:hypothetical protein